MHRRQNDPVALRVESLKKILEEYKAGDRELMDAIVDIEAVYLRIPFGGVPSSS